MTRRIPINIVSHWRESDLLVKKGEVDMLQWNNWLWLFFGGLFFLFLTILYAVNMRIA